MLLFSVSERKVTQCPGYWQGADLVQQDYRVNVLWKLLSQDFYSLSFCMWEREQVYLHAHVCRGQRSTSSVFSQEPSSWTFETKISLPQPGTRHIGWAGWPARLRVLPVCLLLGNGFQVRASMPCLFTWV